MKESWVLVLAMLELVFLLVVLGVAALVSVLALAWFLVSALVELLV
jgi:hypothetical protein